jgi:hypothetical protein
VLGVCIVKLEMHLALFLKTFRYYSSCEGPYSCRKVCVGLKVDPLNNGSGTLERPIRLFIYLSPDVLRVIVIRTDSDRQIDDNSW